MPTYTQSIREIVAAQPSAAVVLARFDIDLCSLGGRSLDGACSELQLSVDQVLEKLAEAATGEQGAALGDPASIPLGRLIQHIVRVHHQRIRKDLPGLAGMAHKLAGRRGSRASELKTVETLVEALRDDLFAHIEKEEQILFPFIAQMDQDAVGVSAPVYACFRSVKQPIQMMMREHESAAGIFTELRSLTHNFEPPAWACITHNALFSGLRAFETDLTQHVYLEDDVLFPRAIALEAELNRRG